MEAVTCSSEHKGPRLDGVVAVTCSREHKGSRLDGVEAVTCSREHKGLRLDDMEALPVAGSTKVPGSTVWMLFLHIWIVLLPAFSLNVPASRTVMTFLCPSQKLIKGIPANVSRIGHLLRA